VIAVAHAICLQCGAAKSRWDKACRSCGFRPGDDPRACAESLVLSVELFEDGTDRARRMSELDRIGERIRAGEQPRLDEADVGRALEIVKLRQGLRAMHGFKGIALVLLYLLPLLLIIVGAIALYLRRR
jgi:hypothetical protein